MTDLKTRLRKLTDFLSGAGPLDGRWFGEAHKPAFWWRSTYLGDINLAIARIEILEAEVKRLKAERDKP